MNIRELKQLTDYLTSLPEDDQCGITIGACFDGYIFVEDYCNDLDAEKMIEMGYIYINRERWWALEGELPA